MIQWLHLKVTFPMWKTMPPIKKAYSFLSYLQKNGWTYWKYNSCNTEYVKKETLLEMVIFCMYILWYISSLTVFGVLWNRCIFRETSTRFLAVKFMVKAIFSTYDWQITCYKNINFSLPEKFDFKKCKLLSYYTSAGYEFELEQLQTSHIF